MLPDDPLTWQIAIPRGAPDEKRKKRRESHNAVERRRRDNINDRITELATLLPEIMLDAVTAGTATNASGSSSGQHVKDESPPQAGLSGLPAGSPPLPNALVNLTPAQIAQQQASNKPNKGVILTKSVEYIRYLQQLVQLQAQRNQELESRVRSLEGHGHGHDSSGPIFASALSPGSSGGLGHSHSASPAMAITPLPTVEEAMMESSNAHMSFDDLLGVAGGALGHSPAQMEDIEDSMRG